MPRITEEEYNNVMTPIITIKSPDSSETILEEDLANYNPNGLRGLKMSLSNGVKKTGQFTMDFLDDNGIIDANEIYKGCRIYIKGKKAHQSTYQNLFAGLCVEDAQLESTKRTTQYTLVFNSMQHIFTHTIVDYERNIPFKNLKEDRLNLVNSDPQYYVGAMVEDILTNINILPNYNGLTLQERGNFTLNGIDKTVQLTLPSLNYIGYASELFDQITDISGFLLGADEDNDIYFRAPVYRSLGHVVKLHANDAATDPIETTMIALNPVARNSNIYQDNYADVIMAKAFDSEVVVNNSSTNNFMSLYNKDISVQIDLRTTKLPYLTLMLSKINAGTDAANPENQPLKGYIATDVNDTIGPDIIASFTIPLRYIPATPQPITRINLRFTGTGEVDITKKYWLVLQETGNSEENTVLWWHDNGMAASKGMTVRSRRRDLPFGRGGTPAYVPIGWVDIDGDFLFSHTFTTLKPILHISKSIIANTKYLDPAPVEVIQSPDGITDSETLQRFLGLANDYSSRIPIPFNFGRLSISDKFIRPGYALLYYDKNNREYQVNINDVTYEFAATNDELPFGTNAVIVDGVAYQLSREYTNSENFYSQFYCR
jgi:hypothetical protein